MFSDEELSQFYRYCIALTQDKDNAFDLLQATFEKLLIRGNKGLDNKRSYFFQMIRNQFIDDERKKRIRNEESYEENKVIELDLPSLEDISIDREQVDQIMELLRSEEREILYLWAVEGYTIQELALHLEIPKGTLLARIFRLRSRIKEICGVESKRAGLI